MDDDYEILSNPSPVNGYPTSSPRENRRITVTVALSAPVQPAANSLALALPIQQQARGSNGGSGGSGGREDCWSEGATAVLIDAWGERYLELNRGNLKQKHWKEVADVVNSRDDYTKTPKTDIQCKNRIDTVKKRYKTEKAKISDGGGITTSKWQFFDRLDQLIGPTAKIPNATGTSIVSNSNSPLRKVPLGIPVILHTGGGGGGTNQYHPQKQPQQIQLKNRKLQFHQCDLPENSDSPVSSDSYPPEGNERKRTKMMKEKEGGKKRKDWGNAMREMSKAIIKFGEVYEQTENSKVKQIVEMENQRMQFIKDSELQRMQFFMKMQSEISQLMDPTNHHSNNSNDNYIGGNNNKDNNNGGNNDNNNHSNNSDSE